MSNPCLKCTVDQNCCRDLHGLLLSESEYHRLFREGADHLSVSPEGRFYKVFANGGGACPHWDNGCTIYGDRPMDCDLYPYTIGNIFEDNGTVYATYHSRTECPLSAELLHPRAQAEKMIHDFLTREYGHARTVVVRYDEGIARLYHLARRAAAKSGKIFATS